jgi:iron complex outermembrane receptor protein
MRLHAPVRDNSELYIASDWVWYGDINMPLYEAVEFKTDGHYEAGVRLGYKNHDSGWDFALYGRNISDQDNVVGFVDFSNNTGFVNEPQTYGVEITWEFGE